MNVQIFKKKTYVACIAFPRKNYVMIFITFLLKEESDNFDYMTYLITELIYCNILPVSIKQS